jgi:flagellar hook-associated protein 3 FlgL
MRISSNTIFDASVSAMQQQSAKLLQAQQQISTGRRILTPADDPIGAAQALQVTQAQTMNAQYSTNAGSASDSLTLEESILGSITSLLQDVRTLSVNAGNGALNRSDRAILATDLSGRYQQLLGLANTVDGNGQYLFSGYQGGVRPFAVLADGSIKYNGDQGQRLIQISASEQMAVSDAGDDVFGSIPNGNGTFVVAMTATNAGSAVMDAGTVLDVSQWNSAANSKDLTVKFSVVGGATTYDIIDKNANKSLLTGAAPAAAGPYPLTYASGSAIDLKQSAPPALVAFDFGAQLNVTGQPADGDSFSVKGSTHQDVFKTINNLVQLLQTSSGGAGLANGLIAAQTNIDNALDNVINVRTSAGSRLKELDAVQNTGEDRALQYSQTLSRLQDVDYAKAAAELMQQQVSLQAAQQSYVKVAGLSPFNYL